MSRRIYGSSAPEDAAAAFTELTGTEDGEYRDTVLAFYDMLRNGASLAELTAEADAKLASLSGTIM